MIRKPLSRDPEMLKDPKYLARVVSEVNAQLDELFSKKTSGGSARSVLDNGSPMPSGNLSFTGDSVQLINRGNATEASINTVAHNLLGGKHSDTLTASVVRGDVIVGNSTPKWARLAIGSTGKFIKSDGTDAAWAYSPFSHCPLDYWTITDVVQAAGSGVRFCEFIFDGSNDYPVGLDDKLFIDCGITGTGTTTISIRDVTNSLTLATKTFTDANARAIYTETTFTNIPTGPAAMQLLVTVDTLQTLTIGGAKWRRRRA